MNAITAGRKALIERLGTITVGNGYKTPAGANVRSGWFNDVLKTEGVGFPMIVVQKGRGKIPEACPRALRVFSGFSICGAVDAGMDGYEDAIEDLEYDLLQCLMPSLNIPPKWLPPGVTSVIVGAPETYPPGEGNKAAVILIPVQLQTLVEDRNLEARYG